MEEKWRWRKLAESRTQIRRRDKRLATCGACGGCLSAILAGGTIFSPVARLLDFPAISVSQRVAQPDFAILDS
jgi:hypothetical protein